MPAGKVNEPPMTADDAIGKIEYAEKDMGIIHFIYDDDDTIKPLYGGQPVIFDVGVKKDAEGNPIADNVTSWELARKNGTTKPWIAEWKKLTHDTRKEWANTLCEQIWCIS